MKILHAIGPAETKLLSTEQLRAHFLLNNLMVADRQELVYTHYDRMIIGGIVPETKKIELCTHTELRSKTFLERREMGIINVGGEGLIRADDKTYTLAKLSCLYLGKGTRNVYFKSADKKNPAMFYLLSAPAHHSYPNKLIPKEKAHPLYLGTADGANKRTVYKYIHAEGIKSCQLVMGATILEQGSVWNSIPPHTHTRRMEVYYYFDLPNEQRVMHFLGEPQQTRHIIAGNNEAAISPPWSTHFGCGTSNYGFVWGMAGENSDYSDMDAAPVATLQ
jgi:4-deoxy-L-threo-5-hexosulose-uronate ketol-isomerase